jgi:hypothetical protein
MGPGLDGGKRKRSLPTIPFYLAAMLITSSTGLRHARSSDDVMQIFSGGEISIASITAPVENATLESTQALEDENFVDPNDRPAPELPVWPPPSSTAPVDPASNPMINAPPQHVDWPNGLPSAQRKPSPPKDPSAQHHH